MTDLTAEKIAELRRLATASDETWETLREQRPNALDWWSEREINRWFDRDEPDCEFIAEASPRVVLSLLDALEDAQRELEEERDLREMAERHAGTMSALASGLPQALDIACGKLARGELCKTCLGTNTFIDSFGHYRLCEEADCAAFLKLSSFARDLRSRT